MADEIMLNNYSDDSQIKKYIQNVLVPKVFKDIPITTLNTGAFSIINEYLSQAIENMAFTSAFYFNESYVTKAVLPDSIYSEAAIFNIGYAFADPSSCNFLLELKISDLEANMVKDAVTNRYEFILDKDTKFNLSNGSVYSLDYDIRIRYKSYETAMGIDKAWDVQYIMDDENSIAVNKNRYIVHRVTETWLCLFVTASEFRRDKYTVVNNMMNNVPNVDTVITCTDHICGFDIRYIDAESKRTGKMKYLDKDHILPIHATVNDGNPYVHYIMDNPQTIRFMWQLNGSKYFVPETNSMFEITIYTCHGKAANFTAFNNEDQPSVISSTSKYANNGNVMKAAFVISGSMGGADIGTTETVRRQTIQAYNTANVLSTDHDLDEWFKTFFFKNVIYPFFFKRRDDPWGRIWGGYIALKDNDDYIFKTNTLHGYIPYDVLYNNNNNTVSNNEIIIPPGWVWTYTKTDTASDLYTVTPYTKGDGVTIEPASTFKNIDEKFIFANPVGIRIQKSPFAIGYFNPWINETVTANRIDRPEVYTSEDNNNNDLSYIYHAYPILTNIKRTYLDNYYRITTFISPTHLTMNDGKQIVIYTKENAIVPTFIDAFWRYFKKPLDMYSAKIPFISLAAEDGYLPFSPDNTYICVKEKVKLNNEYWQLTNVWISDGTNTSFPKDVILPMAGKIKGIIGSDNLWGDGSDVCETMYVSGDATIHCITNKPAEFDDKIEFERSPMSRYYTMKLKDDATVGFIQSIVVAKATHVDIKAYGETSLFMIGEQNARNIYINIKFEGRDDYITYTIQNAKNIYIPYDEENVKRNPDGTYEFSMKELDPNTNFLYADMKAIANAGTVDYYRIKLRNVMDGSALFYVENEIIPFEKNNMRVILHTLLNGVETGRVEMLPVSRESDGSIRYEADMFPLDEMIDVDNRISIASMSYGGGSWTATNGNVASVDATKPEFKITILMKTSIENRESEIVIGDTFTGYRIHDEYSLENISLVQELKQMRSVVKFGDTSVPTEREMAAYKTFIQQVDPSEKVDNIYNIRVYVDDRSHGKPSQDPKFMQSVASDMVTLLRNTESETISAISEVDSKLINQEGLSELESFISSLTHFAIWSGEYEVATLEDPKIVKCYYINGHIYDKPDPATRQELYAIEGNYYYDLQTHKCYVINPESELRKLMSVDLFIWDEFYDILITYGDIIQKIFSNININDGMTIQLMPFVEYSLMNSKRFESFVASFTSIHKAIEPAVIGRLEGNNYLDCKLVATYGKPHTYTTEFNRNKKEPIFWPDLNIQMEFDVALKNQALATDTLSKLRDIIRSYFSKITSIHTAAEMDSMNNNIYISELLRQMLEEKTDNIAYLKFVGWYTRDRYSADSKYMDANIQSIVQKWRTIDDFPKDELENFTPEMFTLENEDIIFNLFQ